LEGKGNGTLYSRFKKKIKENLSRHHAASGLRERISGAYIMGDGIEIGALHNPLSVPRSGRVKYVDRMTLEDLRKHYPDLNVKDLVKVDIIDDGERLAGIMDSSQDFVIANHFIEHTQNPILAVKNMFRVLKDGGSLYLAVPDKRYTFDKQRPSTPIDHLVRDHKEGPEWSKRGHVEEWVRLVDKVRDEEDVRRNVAKIMEVDYSIHYHVFTQDDMVEFFRFIKQFLNLRFETELVMRNDGEVIFIFRKCGG